MSEPREIDPASMVAVAESLSKLVAVGERLAALFSEPPHVSRVLRERCQSARAFREFAEAELLLCRARYGDIDALVRFLADDTAPDPIPWYGFRASDVGNIVGYYRGRQSPKAHARLCRFLVDGLTVVHGAGRLTDAELDAVKQAAGVK